MIVTGHQPNYLPYPGFFEKIARADLFIIVDNVQFVKRGPFGWIHRNKVRTEKGWDWLTVPVLTKGKFTQSIRETRINAAQPWARKHWRTIEWNYRKAPHFGKYADGLRAVFDRKWEWIWELNVELIRLIMGWLEIQTPVKIASEMGVGGHATDLVVDLCAKAGGDTYLSGLHGRDYLDEAKIREAGIRLLYQEFESPEYPQNVAGTFIPNLSTIDLMFNCGPGSRRLLLGGEE